MILTDFNSLLSTAAVTTEYAYTFNSSITVPKIKRIIKSNFKK